MGRYFIFPYLGTTQSQRESFLRFLIFEKQHEKFPTGLEKPHIFRQLRIESHFCRTIQKQWKHVPASFSNSQKPKCSVSSCEGAKVWLSLEPARKHDHTYPREPLTISIQINIPVCFRLSIPSITLSLLRLVLLCFVSCLPTVPTDTIFSRTRFPRRRAMLKSSSTCEPTAGG